MKHTKELNTETPCIGICSTMYGDDVCLGCSRTHHEVTYWNQMTDEEKDQVNQRLNNT